jgi:hypothetical protein
VRGRRGKKRNRYCAVWNLYDSVPFRDCELGGCEILLCLLVS